MLLLTGAILQAACQFYDSESEVRIYCWHDANNVQFIAFNFNGDRAAMIATSTSNMCPRAKVVSFSQLAENPNLLKERVFATNLPIITYDSSNSNSSTKTYVYKTRDIDPWEYVPYTGQKIYNPYSQNYTTHKEYLKFSSSGNSLTFGGDFHSISRDWRNRTLERVTLDELLNIYSEIQAERERRARWR